MKKPIEITTVTSNIDDDRHISALRVIAARALIAIGRTSTECRFVFVPGPTSVRVKGLSIDEEARFRQAHGHIAGRPGAGAHPLLVKGTAPCPAHIFRDRFLIPPSRAVIEELRAAVLRRFEYNVSGVDPDVATVTTRIDWTKQELPEFQVDDDLGELTLDLAINLFGLSSDEGWRIWQRSKAAKTVKNFTACEKIR